MASEFDDIVAKYGEAPAPSEFADIVDKYGEKPPAPTLAEKAWDVARQIPAGLVAGTEAVATFPAQAAGFVGGLVNKHIYAGDPEAEQQQAAIRDLAKREGGAAGISQYLPKPETRYGQFARTASEFIPSAVAGNAQFSPLRAAGVGVTAGLTSEGLGQATEGTKVEPYARAAGALIAGTAAGRLAEGAAAKSAVKRVSANVEKEANQGYEAFRNAGFGINPAETAKFTTQVRSDLYGAGRGDVTAPDTWKALEAIDKKPFTSPQDFQAAYQQLGNVAKDATKSTDRMAAKIAQEQLLGTLENMKPSSIVTQVATGADPREAVAIFQKANADWAALKRAENLNQRIAAGELRAGANYSGLNLENELRRRIGVLADPAVSSRGFSPGEQKAFRQYAEGTFRSNAPRYVKNILGGGGGLGALSAAGAGAGAGAYFGLDPLTYAGVTGLAGLSLAKYGNANALRRARELELMLLSRAPSAGSVPAVRSGAPLSLAPATLSTIGENYDQPLRLTVRPSDR